MGVNACRRPGYDHHMATITRSAPTATTEVTVRVRMVRRQEWEVEDVTTRIDGAFNTQLRPTVDGVAARVARAALWRVQQEQERRPAGAARVGR